jgi:putative addiction module component (TIGR02574 family)
MRCVLPCGSLWGVIQTSYWERSGLSPCFTACIYSYNFPMTQEARELLQKALALPDNERAELAGNLISSLDATVDQDVDAAWQQEVVRRLHEVQSGKVGIISWEEVQQKGRTLLNGSRPLRFHAQKEQEYLAALSWYRERSPIADINFESYRS